MISRFIAFLILAYGLGFAVFSILLPQPLDLRSTDAVVVLTGGAGRIDRGLAVLQEGAAKKMLISGVDRAVRPHELALRYKVPDELFECCITLGREAIDTRSNAVETAYWLEKRGYNTVRLITSDWHMRRSAFELRQALPPEVSIVYDAVPTQPSLWALFREYNKYVLRRASALIGM